MEQIVYADVLFIVNFSMDFLAMYISARLLHHNSHFAALIMSAGIGGVYGVLSLVYTGNTFISIILHTATALLMCFIVFGAPTIMTLIRNTLIFYGINFLMGGAMTGIFYLTNKGLMGRGIVINGDPNTLYSDISPLLLVIIATGAIIFSYICSFVMKKLKDVKKSDIYIRIGDRETSFTGICDSGNLLVEPTSGLPCLVCTFEVIKEVIPIGLAPLFRDKKLGILEFADPAIAAKIKLIPMHTVGSSGIIIGIIPDEVRINGQNKRICIACDPQTRSFSDTESIIPSSVM